jgi:hypothetical protein
MITGAQIRAARAFLRWTPQTLSKQAKLPVDTIYRAERQDGEAPLTTTQENAIRGAFQGAGVEFTNDHGPGIRMRTQAVVGLSA